MPDHRREGILLLFDQVYRDRGKVSLLGIINIGTVALKAGEQTINVAAVLDLSRPEPGDADPNFALVLRDREAGTALVRGTLTMEATPGAGHEGGGVDPDFQSVVVPFALTANLEPGHTYVVELRRDDDVGELITSATFVTASS